jgi:hypothetical protein
MQRYDRALNLAAPEGYVRVFLDEGPPMVALLEDAARARVSHDSVNAAQSAGALLRMLTPEYQIPSLAELLGGISPRGQRTDRLRADVGTVHRHLVARLDRGFEDQLAVGDRPLERCFVAFDCLAAMECSRPWIDGFYVRTE